ncbi:MAG: DUF1553 domain-containing protein [Planctomycetaceae bacterium]|nr:DUF1553 domain-containing protein [Planctomycetaceae bacterium]
MKRFFVLTCGFLISVVTCPVLFAQSVISFNRQIRPILADKCFHCHGPDAQHREADLRLDQEDSAKQERDDHHIIIAGDPDHSELVGRILSEDTDLKMPPADSGRSLSSAEKQLLQEWIRQGALWEDHWAFVPVRRPSLPTVKHSEWPKNSIDAFVLARLEAAGLEPAAEAGRETWLRRVSLDLTGLPPTIDELDRFLADNSLTAYETVVDRLLASPRYGEHMAVTWLDAARYADTDGYQNDGPRDMWRWRDWVIEAFNSNLPFDQFTIEQLAGDLLPNPTMSQIIATGFNRNHRYNSEAGLVLEEFLLENAVDRVDTTSTVWMGLTMGCGRCHDHKYDPFSQREYYQLISFFDNVAEAGRAIKFGNSEPWIIAPTSTQQQQLETLDQQLREAELQLQTARQDFVAAAVHIKPFLLHAAMQKPMLQDAVVRRGLQQEFHFEDMQQEGIAVEKGSPVLRTGLHQNSATVGGQGILSLGKVGDVQCQTRSTISFWLKPDRTESGVVLSRQSAGTTRPGFAVEFRDGHLQYFIIGRWSDAVGAVETVQQLPVDTWTHVAVTNDGTQRDVGMQIWLNGQLATTRSLYNTNSNTGGTGKEAVLRIGGGVVGDLFAGQVDDLLFYNRTLFDDEIAALADTHSLDEILSTDPAARTASMNAHLESFVAAVTLDESAANVSEETIEKDPPGTRASTTEFSPEIPVAVQSFVAKVEQFAELRERRVRLMDSFPTTMVMRDRPQPHQTFVRIRGVYDRLGESVESGTPEVFPASDDASLMTRLDFAKWLVSGQHPLTARVAVNRDWQRYFGIGLVRTAEDFGQQGEQPSHPDLLDWLAAEFVESGWDMKALHRQIVLSATYRQSSQHRRLIGTDGETLEDPDNRLLARGPRLRLSARQLRDQALFVSGLMNPEIGGPSVSPYQPAGLWEEMSNMTYRQSKGKDLYRRGLYTLWKRTVAPPALAILDAADRENCVVRPKRTNTPLQALTLLNETTFVESARHLAERLLRESPDDPVRSGFRILTSRFPTDREYSVLHDALQTYRARFLANPAEARQLLAVGESATPADLDPVEFAAVTMLCNVLLNLDEVVTHE